MADRRAGRRPALDAAAEVLGRKSGEQRTTPLVFKTVSRWWWSVRWRVRRASRLVSECQRQSELLGAIGRKKMTAVARDARPEEREALWPKLDMVFPAWGFFQKQTDRPFPIVILTPTGQA
jgi:hypothetical protein